MKNFFGTDGGCLDAFFLSKEINNDKELFFLSDKEKKGSYIEGCPVIGTFSSIENNSLAQCEFVYQCGSVKNHLKRDIWFKKAEENQMIPKTLVSNHSYIHESAKIGAGSIIYHGVKIMRNVEIGKNCVILPNTIINHDARVGDFSVINSSCVLNGNVKIGSKVFLGSLTFLIEKKSQNKNIKTSLSLFFSNLGIFLILFSLFFFQHNWSHPSFVTLVPLI